VCLRIEHNLIMITVTLKHRNIGINQQLLFFIHDIRKKNEFMLIMLATVHDEDVMLMYDK